MGILKAYNGTNGFCKAMSGSHYEVYYFDFPFDYF